MLKSSLRDYSDTYILVNGTITITGGPETRKSDERNKEVIFTNSATFTEYISKKKKRKKEKIKNTQVDSAKDLHVVMLMFNLIESGKKISNFIAILPWAHNLVISNFCLETKGSWFDSGS